MVYLRKITTYNNFWLQRIIYTCEFLIQQINCRMATGQSKVIEQQMSVMSHCTAGCHRRTDDSTRTIPRLLAQTDKTLPVPEINFNVMYQQLLQRNRHRCVENSDQPLHVQYTSRHLMATSAIHWLANWHHWGGHCWPVYGLYAGV